MEQLPEHDAQLLTALQVARILQVNEQTVRRWLRDGELRAAKLSGAGYRIEAGAVRAFLRDRAVGSAEERR